MCLLSAFAPHVTPERGQLGVEFNPHGFGFGWQCRGGVYFHTGLDADIEIELFYITRALFPESWMIFHARHNALGAPVSLENCQPLRLPDGNLLAHNGGLFDVEGDVSDTRIFVEKMLPSWDIANPAQMALLESRLGYNKIVILGPSGPPTILNRHLGIQEGGAWFSNADYSGSYHLAAGQCGACATAMPGAPECSRCDDCAEAARMRLSTLMGP